MDNTFGFSYPGILAIPVSTCHIANDMGHVGQGFGVTEM